jgi:hypothetical protein
MEVAMAVADTPSRSGQPLALRSALEARDLEAVIESMSPNVVLRSPITTGFTFTGRQQIRALYEAVFDGLQDFAVMEEVGDGSRRVLVIAGHIGDQEFEEIQLLSLDADGLVCELTLFFRPLPALPALAAALAGTWLAPRSRPKAALLKLLVAPLVLMTRFGDQIVVKVVNSIAGMTSPPV